MRRVLFVPVSGAQGVGEYRRSLFLAQGLLARCPDWDVRLLVAETAPYIDEVPVPIFRTRRSPTLAPDEVDTILEGFRPHVVVFDCAGRGRSLRAARRQGAKIVFITNLRWRNRRGFRISRLRHTDEVWIAAPEFVAGGLTLLERLKLRLLDKTEPVFLGSVFPEPIRSDLSPEAPFFVCCPGGGGNDVNGQTSGAVFAATANTIAEAAGIHGILVTGENFAGELAPHPGLTVQRSLPGGELFGLLSESRFAVIGGGDLLSQTIASRVPAVAAPVAKDQHRQVESYARAGLCIRSEPDRLAQTTIAANRDGRLESLVEKLRRSNVGNGLASAVERIEALATG